MLRANLIVQTTDEHASHQRLDSSLPRFLHDVEFCVSSPPVQESWSLTPHEAPPALADTVAYEDLCMITHDFHAPSASPSLWSSSSSSNTQAAGSWRLPFLYLYAPSQSRFTAPDEPMQRGFGELVMRALRAQLRDMCSVCHQGDDVPERIRPHCRLVDEKNNKEEKERTVGQSDADKPTKCAAQTTCSAAQSHVRELHVCWTAQLLHVVAQDLIAAMTSGPTQSGQQSDTAKSHTPKACASAPQTSLSIRDARVPSAHRFTSAGGRPPHSLVGSRRRWAVCHVQLSLTALRVVSVSVYDSLLAGQVLRRLYRDHLVPADRHRRYGGEAMPKLMQCVAQLRCSVKPTHSHSDPCLINDVHPTSSSVCAAMHDTHTKRTKHGSNDAEKEDEDENSVGHSMFVEVAREYARSASYAQRGVLFVYRHALPCWDSFAPWAAASAPHRTQTRCYPPCSPSDLSEANVPLHEPAVHVSTDVFRRVQKQSWRAVYTHHHVEHGVVSSSNVRLNLESVSAEQTNLDVRLEKAEHRCNECTSLSRTDAGVRLPQLDYVNDALLRVRLDVTSRWSSREWHHVVWSSELLAPARAALMCSACAGHEAEEEGTGVCVTALQAVLYAMHRLLIIAVANSAQVSLLQLEYNDYISHRNKRSHHHHHHHHSNDNNNSVGALVSTRSHYRNSHMWRRYDEHAHECVKASVQMMHTLLAWHHHSRQHHHCDANRPPLSSQNSAVCQLRRTSCSEAQNKEVYWCYEMYCKLHIRAVRLWGSAVVGKDAEARRTARALRETLRRWNNKMDRITRGGEALAESVEERTLRRLSMEQWERLQREAYQGLGVWSRA